MTFRFQKPSTAIGTVLSCPLCRVTPCKDLPSCSTHQENFFMILYGSVSLKHYVLIAFDALDSRFLKI